ncbi:MAG TPA: methyl-accepting chemotaxis protein [Geobacterales bacterium]|nr:methyl-accepting chemotaxis protein [Geobacterales bacterium]
MTFKRYRHWSILRKIVTISVATIVLVALFTLAFLLPFTERKMFEGRRSAARNTVEIAYSLVAEYETRIEKGEFSKEEGQRRAMTRIRHLRYNDKDYFWINDMTPRMVMHPTKPELEGTDLSGNKDPQGKALFVEFVNVCKAQGGGFVDYLWPKPGASEPVPKISYVKLYEPWGWIIGSGVYVDDIKAQVTQVRWAVLGGLLFLAIAILSIAGSVGQGIVRPLRHVVTNLKEIASGDSDLTKRLTVERQDESGELAEAFNHFMDNMAGIIGKVSQTATLVASAASQLHITSDQMATGAEEVAAQAGTVATAGEELAATTMEIAQNCATAFESSQEATSAATSGAGVVSATIEVMNRIAGRVKGSAQTIDSLGSRSDQIGEIVGVIEDIADQTNLLALNAAIEAARAGEQGRGFAVVADEVRALAERTTKATKEISQMIKGIQAETRGAVAAMNEGVREVEKGTTEASRSGEALQRILDLIHSVTGQVNQIATAAEEQTATSAEISNNMQQITDVVQKTSRGAQESATAASELSKLSDDLQQLVGRFRLSA